MDEGTARMKANDPVHALESFQKANELMHVPTTGLAVAKAQLAAGHLVEAREAALEVARTQHEAGEPAVFEKARKHAREMEAQVKPRIPTVKIKIRGGQASRIAVDDADVPIELAAEPVPVNPGKHHITAKGTDGSEGKTDIDLQEADKKEVDVILLPKDNSADSGKPLPTKDNGTNTPPPPPPTKVAGFGNDEVDRSTPRRSPLAEGLIFGGFGAAVIGVGIGSVTGVMTLGKASDVAPQCARNICAPSAQKDLDSANTLSTVSTIAFGIGVVGLGAGILGLVMPREGGRRGSIRPTMNGVEGTF